MNIRTNQNSKISSSKAALFLATLMMVITVSFSAHASSRIKDIVQFQGVRDNLLVGYGLVVGLNNTGE